MEDFSEVWTTQTNTESIVKTIVAVYIQILFREVREQKMQNEDLVAKKRVWKK